jgi:hypothetical protein
MILTREWVEAKTGPFAEAHRDWFVAIEGGLVIATGLYILGSVVGAVRRRLPVADTVRLLFGPTEISTGLSTPDISRVLIVAPGEVKPPADDAASDHARAITELLARSHGITDPTRRDVAELTRTLATSIEELESELGHLSREGSVTELDRLSAQLATLEADAVESPDHRELVSLVRAQLDVVRRLHVRCELVAQQRRQRLAILRGLWTTLSQPTISEAKLAELVAEGRAFANRAERSVST